MPAILPALTTRPSATLVRNPALESDRTLRVPFTDTRLYPWLNHILRARYPPEKESLSVLAFELTPDTAGDM